MTPRALMFQGTGSDVGKSVLVAGIARALTRRGLRVKPFKPQNMSNNAAVTPCGGEIGRAQALQAQACLVNPHVDMNPVLLKPDSEIGAQIILRGKVWGQMNARDYQNQKAALLPEVIASYERLSAQSDIVLVEGAGSASEVNLRDFDIANMGFAESVDVPVVMIGDINRGGVIASLVGTKAVLSAEDGARIKGFIINQLRGDAQLFAPALNFISNKTGWPSFGVLPHLDCVADLPQEDRYSFAGGCYGTGSFRVVVPLFPHIANFDDFDALKFDPALTLSFVEPREALPVADLIILPGSKSTVSDLHVLRRCGWDIDLFAHIRRGGAVMGICGGFQMLGGDIEEELSSLGKSTTPGLGLLSVTSRMRKRKTVRKTRGVICASEAPFEGYEIHHGTTGGMDAARPFVVKDDGECDGAVSPDGRIFGTYQHGIFKKASARRAIFARLGAGVSAFDDEERVNKALDGLAEAIETHLDVEQILSLAFR